MGECFIAFRPRCPVHGVMHIQDEQVPLTQCTWICHGFDGEGCDHVVHGRDIEWIRADELEFKMSL